MPAQLTAEAKAKPSRAASSVHRKSSKRQRDGMKTQPVVQNQNRHPKGLTAHSQKLSNLYHEQAIYRQPVPLAESASRGQNRTEAKPMKNDSQTHLGKHHNMSQMTVSTLSNPQLNESRIPSGVSRQQATE